MVYGGTFASAETYCAMQNGASRLARNRATPPVLPATAALVYGLVCDRLGAVRSRLVPPDLSLAATLSPQRHALTIHALRGATRARRRSVAALGRARRRAGRQTRQAALLTTSAASWCGSSSTRWTIRAAAVRASGTGCSRRCWTRGDIRRAAWCNCTTSVGKRNW